MGRVPVTSNAGRDIAPVGLPSRCLIPDTGSEGRGFSPGAVDGACCELAVACRGEAHGNECVAWVCGGHSNMVRMATELGCEIRMVIS